MMSSNFDVRCQECVAIDCECPSGYAITEIDCPICSYEFVLMRPACMTGNVACPQCKVRVES